MSSALNVSSAFICVGPFCLDGRSLSGLLLVFVGVVIAFSFSSSCKF